MKKRFIIGCLVLIMTMLCGCQLSLMSDVKTTSVNGVTIQHSVEFDNIYEVDSGAGMKGFKFDVQNLKTGDPHYDYGWILLYDKEITDINDLQEKVRTYTCANMTHRWYESRNTNVDGTVTMQGYYADVAPGTQGFADLDVISDKYKVDVYAVSKDGNTLIAILAINQTSTKLSSDETSMIRGTLSRSEDFIDSISD